MVREQGGRRRRASTTIFSRRFSICMMKPRYCCPCACRVADSTHMLHAIPASSHARSNRQAYRDSRWLVPRSSDGLSGIGTTARDRYDSSSIAFISLLIVGPPQFSLLCCVPAGGQPMTARAEWALHVISRLKMMQQASPGLNRISSQPKYLCLHRAHAT